MMNLSYLKIHLLIPMQRLMVIDPTFGRIEKGLRSWDEACEESSRETLQGWKDEDDAKKRALEDAQKKGTMVLMC